MTFKCHFSWCTGVYLVNGFFIDLVKRKEGRVAKVHEQEGKQERVRIGSFFIGVGYGEESMELWRRNL